jgi:hypothetical protein
MAPRSAGRGAFCAAADRRHTAGTFRIDADPPAITPPELVAASLTPSRLLRAGRKGLAVADASAVDTLQRPSGTP